MDKRVGYILVVCVISIPLFFIIFRLLFFSPSAKNVQTPVLPIPTAISSRITPYIHKLTLLSSTPSLSSLLPVGKSQTFSLTFSDLPENIHASITAAPISSPYDTSIVQSTVSTTTGHKTIQFITTSTLLPSTIYTIIISSENTVIFSQPYITERAEITKAPANNSDLKIYLPYETDTYRLSFNQQRNAYIFNFKIVESDPSDIQTQFEKAKSDASAFINSKGVDINSIVIDWRHS